MWPRHIDFAAILCRLFNQANFRKVSVMAERDTLLAHMIPGLTNQVEVAATKALVYILNKSEAAMSALNGLIQDTIGASLEPVTSLVAEKSYTTTAEDSGRVDFVGYDKGANQRVVGEAKFGAALSVGQGGGYLGQLAEGTSVLLFVVPDYRIDYLWGEVRRDVEGHSAQWRLGQTRINGRIHSAEVEGRDWHLMMVSWQAILQRMHETSAGEPHVQADIRQLLGLTERLDREALLPFSKEDLSPQIARRMSDLRRIYDQVWEKCKTEDWITWRGTSRDLQAAYGHYCQLSGADAWFGVYYELWAQGDCVDTPFWVTLYNGSQSLADEISRKLDLRAVENNYGHQCFPVFLKLGAEGPEIVAALVLQLQRIAESVKGATSDSA